MTGTSLPPARPARRWRLLDRRIAGVLLAGALIVGNGVQAIGVLHDMRRMNEWVGNTRQALIELYDARGVVRDAEIAQRDFLVTGDPQFLDAYRQATDAATAALGRVGALIVDDPGQQARLAKVATALETDRVNLAAGIARREAGGPAEGTPAEREARRASTEQLRADLAAMQDEARRLSDERAAIADHRASVAQILLALGTVASLSLIGLIFYHMTTEAAVRERALQDRALELGHAISALRQREAELRRGREQLRTLIEATPAAIVMFDRDMRYLAVSQRFRDDYRLGDQPLVGRSHYDVFPNVDEHRRDIHRRALAGHTERAEEQPFHHADGTLDWVRWEVRPWHDGDGAVGGIVLFTQFVTARKQAELALAASEAQLRQAQKMEAVGQLTGGIAHDFNNMLGVIIGNVELLQDALKDSPDQMGMANEILNTALSGAELTRRLLTFARKQSVTPASIDLGALLAQFTPLLRRTLGETITIATEVAVDLWHAWADQGQVGEALLNLTINARDAMPDGGALILGAANAHLDATFAARHPDVAEGDYVVLSVTDTGQGMTPEVLQRAMEPFYTTKDSALGTGLGLSMVYGFAKQSGGHLALASELGQGTTVRLYLPRGPVAAIDPPPAAAPGRDGAPQGASILVVDDSLAMGEVARRHLTDLGYCVTLAGDGPAALAVLRTGQPFDLLFTDVAMPNGMTGYDLAEQAQHLRPALKVLLTTGYPGAAAAGHAPPPGEAAHPILLKPYRRRELATQVRAVLDV